MSEKPSIFLMSEQLSLSRYFIDWIPAWLTPLSPRYAELTAIVAEWVRLLGVPQLSGIASRREQYYIPDFLANWRWPRRLNPHHAEVKAASAAWARSFGAFSPKAQHAYDLCDFDLLTSLVYPMADKARLRTGCDLMHTLFIFDEHSDVAHADGVQNMVDIIKDALRDPSKPRPKGEWIGGEITRQFWELAVVTASPGGQKRFFETLETYLQAVVQEAADRDNRYTRTVEEYLQMRRETGGAKPFFALIEFDMDLPDEVHEHPVLKELTALAADMVSIGNDIASYNVEQARGDDHNVIAIVMHHNKTNVQGAMDWVEIYHRNLVERWTHLYENELPTFGEPTIDAQSRRYVDGLGIWVRGNEQWSFESERYFGKRGPEIFKTRKVTLLPKKKLLDVGPQLVDGSLL